MLPAGGAGVAMGDKRAQLESKKSGKGWSVKGGTSGIASRQMACDQ
jgi:hypothetical protein